MAMDVLILFQVLVWLLVRSVVIFEVRLRLIVRSLVECRIVFQGAGGSAEAHGGQALSDGAARRGPGDAPAQAQSRDLQTIVVI